MTDRKHPDLKPQEPLTEASSAHEELVPVDDSVIGKVFVRSAIGLLGLAVIIAVAVMISSRPAKTVPAVEVVLDPAIHVVPQAQALHVQFTNITRAAGIDFIHENGATGEKLLPETMGAGAAFLDYDNDGDVDLFLVNGSHWEQDVSSDSVQPAQAFYQNDGTGRFKNVTTDVGLDVTFYGMGAAVGDYDNDGRVDIFVTTVGSNRLYRNMGEYFQDVTQSAGVAGDSHEWSASSAFLDYDNDGDLDLFVSNYVRWSREIDLSLDYRLVGIGRAYGPPMNFEGTHSYLYRNDGDGKFSDVSKVAGVQVLNQATGLPVGKGLAVMPFDVDQDGHIDILVANDTVANFFFHNQGDGTFAERGGEFGLAFGPGGRATGAMGIDGGYYRNNDDIGFFIGNFANEMSSVYVSQGSPTMFADEAIGEQIGATTRSMLTFGVSALDFDLDGRLDLLHANGHIENEIGVVQPSQHYEQPTQLFWNCGMNARGCFVPVDVETTGDLSLPIVGRGSAVADIDGDGDQDIILTQVGRAPVLLRNDQQLGHHWIRLKLVGASGVSNRDAIGAWVEASLGGDTLRRQVMPSRSYLSQSELVVTVGLGASEAVDHQVKILWPDGSTEMYADLPVDRLHTIQQDQGLIR